MTQVSEPAAFSSVVVIYNGRHGGSSKKTATHKKLSSFVLNPDNAMLQPRLRTSITQWAIIMVVLVSGCASETALPIEPVRSITFRTVGRIPVIEARLNGKPAAFIIDTGASVSILNTSEAAFYGFEVSTLQSDAVDVTGFSGVSQIHNAGRCTIEIGSLRITHLRFRSRDMPRLCQNPLSIRRNTNSRHSRQRHADALQNEDRLCGSEGDLLIGWHPCILPLRNNVTGTT